MQSAAPAIHYHFDLRVRVDNLKIIIRDQNPALKMVAGELRSIYQAYNNNEEVSAAGRRDFYGQLHHIADDYYQTKIYQHKKWYQKLGIFFGIMPEEERNFRQIIAVAGYGMKQAENLSKSSWKEGWFMRWISEMFGAPKGNPALYLKTFDEKQNQHSRLRIYSNRLMRDEKFSDEKYRHFHGLSFELSAYKLKRVIERFIRLYQKSLTADQNIALTECVESLEKFIELKGCAVYSQYLSLVQSGHSEVNREQRLNDMVFNIHDELKALPVGKRLLVPHGYHYKGNEGGKERESGHAALVEFERLNEYQYKISFINTGAGVAGQKRGFVSSIKLHLLRWLNISYVDDVTEQEIHEKNIIKLLFEAYLVPSENNAQACEKMNEPINLFADRLQQTEHYINLQINGTCAFSCWLEWLGWKLDDGLFKALDLFINNRTLEKLENFNNSEQVLAELKSGVPDLLSAGTRLVEKNRKDLSDWLNEKNRDMEDEREQQENTPAISAFGGIYNVAKSLGVNVELDKPAANDDVGLLGRITGLFY